MSYIDRNLLPNERVIFRTRKHLIIFFVPVVCLILACLAMPYMHEDQMLRKVIWTPWVVTLLVWGYELVEYYASEYAVTDKRVMMREGFFTRHANETRVSTISQVNIDQSIIGQIVNYGTIVINARNNRSFFIKVMIHFPK